MSAVMAALAAWANDTSCSLPEANCRAGVYAAVAELIGAADEISRTGEGMFRLRRALGNVGGGAK